MGNPLLRRTTRRGFLKQSLAAGASLAFPWVIPSRALGKDGAVASGERIVLGVIGIGPRCTHDLGCLLEEADMQCVAICDVQASRRGAAKNMVDRKYGNKDCAVYTDFREMLTRKDIDAVLIATSDRWHATASMLAAKAGKDIYSEKPCAMSIVECQALNETIRRYGRVYQAGTQRRSIANFQLAMQLARSGKLGKIHTLHASIYRPQIRYDWLPAEPEPPKDVVDWDMWLGPAPWRPFNKAYVSGAWRNHHDFDAGATLLDWGAHTVDLCQWANGADDTTPLEFEPTKDNIIARYANGVKLVMDYLATPFGDRSPHYRTQLGTCPVRYEGDEGWVETGDSGDIEVHPASLKGELRRLRATKRRAGTDAGSHGRNFLDCVKSRAATNCNADIARRSHIACFAAVTAWLLNRKVTFDPVREVFVGDDEANRLRSRSAREPWCL
ncbi:MAG: Gfo/Idh/MocA family oxidoreductase [Planctomycetota bacterium]|nr:Gfo/Idh/MocA family oxidoreductase [Planctomycetota bacterium]